MNFEALTYCLVMLSNLWFPGQAAPVTHQPAERHRVVVATPTPKPVPRPTATMAPPVTPAAAPAPAATSAKSEIASEQTCPGQADVNKTASVLVCLTTTARAFHRLPAVNADAALMAAAAAKNQDMATCGYGHTACGRAFNYWIDQKDYAGRCSAENIAMGQKTPRQVFEGWMNSPGHRANILSKNYQDIGVATLSRPNGRLWTMHLGGCKA